MKTYIKYTLVFAMMGFLFIQSCKKGVDSPNFDISFVQKTYAVGEKIKFDITGGAELITFYSGESGKEYANRERVRADGKASLQFTSYRRNTAQDSSLLLLVSTDFNGRYDVENVQKATWTDITSRAIFSTGVDNTPSGSIDLSDFQQANVPVYIAFRYYGMTKPYYQPEWTIKNILINNNTNDGQVLPISTTADLWAGAVDFAGTAAWTYSATQIQLAGIPANLPANIDWLISKPVLLDQVTHSLGVNVKSNPTSKIASYEFSGFTAPGTYTVTFEGINSNIDDIKKDIRQFTITVI